MPASRGAVLRLARIRIGEVAIGIPIESVVLALPLPENLDRLPLRGHALLGMIAHDDVPVPVVDLAHWLAVGPAPADAAAQLLLLRARERTVALRVDALDGLVEVDAGALRRLHHAEDPNDVFHSAVPAGDGVLLSLLEADRLADLAACWSAMAPADGMADAPARACDALAGSACYALLETGRGLLGVPPGALAEVVALPALMHFGASAWCNWRGRQLALMSCAALFDDDAAGTGVEDAPLLAVLIDGERALGIPVQAVLQLDDFGPGLARPDGIGTRVVDAEGAEVLLVDPAALLARHPEAARMAGDGVADSASAAVNAQAYIVFDAAGRQALPIGAIEQIVPLAAPAGPTMAWHGEVIPLLDLRRGAPGDAGMVLVARGAHGLAGHVVSRVESLIPASAGRLFRMGAGRAEFIMADDEGHTASYRIATLGAPPGAAAPVSAACPSAAP